MEDDEEWAKRKRIDVSAVPFPSDRLSIGDLRRLSPNVFDDGPGVTRCPVFMMVRTEQDVARRAFLRAKGKFAFAQGMDEGAISATPITDRELGDFLHEHYTECGLSSGREESRELVAGIKEAARKLAKGSLDKGRGGRS